MKKTLAFSLIATMLLFLPACGGSQAGQPPTDQSTAESSASLSSTPEPSSSVIEPSNQPMSAVEPQAGANTKALVVYFSMPETTDPNNMTKAEEDSAVVINGEVLGNTQYVAHIIRENTGADIFRIEPKIPYPTDHTTLVDLADDEQAKNARPELLSNVENLEKYDIIFLGYPNWWSDMPMILYTFLESYDLSGKTIIPFNTHGGSGFSNTISTIAELQPNATIERNGFTVSRNSVDDCESDVITWLQSLKIAK